MNVDFDDYFDKLSKLNTKETNLNDTIRYLIQNKNIDIVSYKEIIRIIPNNLAYMKKNNDGKYFIEIDFERLCDIATNFEITPNEDINVSLKLRGKQVNIDENTKLIPISAMYSALLIRFTFENEPKPLTFSYDAYLAQTDLRKKLATCDRLTTGCSVYSGGTVDFI